MNAPVLSNHKFWALFPRVQIPLWYYSLDAFAGPVSPRLPQGLPGIEESWKLIGRVDSVTSLHCGSTYTTTISLSIIQ